MTLVRKFRTTEFDENDMKYTICPTLLEKFEYLRTNGRPKQVFPIWKYLLLNIYTYAREDYLLSDRLSLLPG